MEWKEMHTIELELHWKGYSRCARCAIECSFCFCLKDRAKFSWDFNYVRLQVKCARISIDDGSLLAQTTFHWLLFERFEHFYLTTSLRWTKNEFISGILSICMDWHLSFAFITFWNREMIHSVIYLDSYVSCVFFYHKCNAGDAKRLSPIYGILPDRRSHRIK